MCGRLVVSVVDLSSLVPRFHVEVAAVLRFGPHFNIAPTQLVPVITNEAARRLDLFRFGLVPAWAANKRPGQSLINARAETAGHSRVFARSLAQRRCIVPVQGYYEWLKTPHGKQPLFVHDRAGGVIALAGIWERSVTQGQTIESFAIVTRPSAGFLRDVHDRMPLVVPSTQIDAWLASEARTPAELAAVLEATPDMAALEAYPVAALVNSPKNDTPECVEPAAVDEGPARRQLQLFEDADDGAPRAAGGRIAPHHPRQRQNRLAQTRRERAPQPRNAPNERGIAAHGIARRGRR